MKITGLFPVTGAVLLLCGCAAVPSYTRPPSPVPGVFSDGMKSSGSSLEGLIWQNVFPDAKLQQIIALSLVNNRDLRIAALNVERARALYGVQRAELLPSISATGTASKQRMPGDLSRTGSPTISDEYSVNLGITAWEIDLFGRIRSLKKKALEEYLATEQARRGAQTALVSEVARAYLTLAADRENLELVRSTLKGRKDVHEMIRKQYDNGLVTELDLRRSQTQVDVVSGDIARYTQLVALDKNALDLLVGVSVPADFLPAGLMSVVPPEDLSPGLSSDVLLRRPDIMAAEHQLKAAHAYIETARAAFFPRISLTSAFGTASADLAGLFDTDSESWRFVPQVSMPVFDARIWAAFRVSKATREIALAQYEKAIQTAFREVADCLAVRGTIDEQIAAQESIVDSARKVHELSDKRYTQGIDGYLGVLDAERSLYAAQQGLTSLRLARLVNRVRTFAALGGE